MNKYKVITFTICLVLLVLYSCRIYQVNKNAPNLRDYTMETLGKEFDAFGGKMTVKNIDLVESKDLDISKDLGDMSKKFIDKTIDRYVRVDYTIKGIDNKENLDIKLNLNEYIFYDGLPAPKKTEINEYRYLLPVPNEARIKDGDIKVFISNIKSNELEHHYIRR